MCQKKPQNFAAIKYEDCEAKPGHGCIYIGLYTNMV